MTKRFRKSPIVVGVAICLMLAIFAYVDVGPVIDRLRQLTTVAMAAILGLFIANLAVVTLRLQVILYSFGFPTAIWTAFRASTAGQIAGLVVFQVVGQLAGRHVVLVGQGIPGSAVTLATAYERLMLVLVGGTVFIAGAVAILGQAAVTEMLHSIALPEVLATAAVAIGLSLWLGRSHFERLVIGRLFGRRSIGWALVVTGLTIVGQALVLAAFVVGVRALHPEAPVMPVLAASAVVSFAAALPISINGWGVREVAAVFAFGLLGIPAADALAVSVFVGIAATVVVLAAAPVVSVRPGTAQPGGNEEICSAAVQARTEGLEAIAAWILAHAVAVLIFFQVHLQWTGEQFGLPEVLININFADPVAILGGCGFALYWLSRRQWPAWRWPLTNLWFGLASATLLIGFVIGVLSFGVTSWALQNRLVGWLVLLAYCGTGALLASLAGIRGIRRLCETLIAAGAAVVLSSVAVRCAASSGWISGIDLGSNFQGFANNRNAFAVQMAICVAVALAHSSVRARVGMRIKFGALLGIILLGLWLSQSRAGLGTAVVMLILAWAGRLGDRYTIAAGVVTALALWAVAPLVSLALTFIGGDPAVFGVMGSPAELRPMHDAERWQSILQGLAMWWQAPVFGAGLGAFMQTNLAEYGVPLVIHNSLVWLLAELGVVGATIFLIGFGALVYGICPRRLPLSPRDRLLLMSLLIFGVFSLVHEVLYQRIFWLMLGLTIASQGAGRELRRTAISSALSGQRALLPIERQTSTAPLAADCQTEDRRAG